MRRHAPLPFAIASPTATILGHCHPRIPLSPSPTDWWRATAAHAGGECEANREARANAEPSAKGCALEEGIAIKRVHKFHAHGVIGGTGTVLMAKNRAPLRSCVGNPPSTGGVIGATGCMHIRPLMPDDGCKKGVGPAECVKLSHPMISRSSIVLCGGESVLRRVSRKCLVCEGISRASAAMRRSRK
jgi:hypothetical protein